MNHFLITPTESAQKIMDVNFMGTFLVTREATKLIKNSSNGRIINFTTVAAPLSLEGEAVYASAKAAIEKLTQVLAKELAPLKITVNAVGPSPTQTALIAGIPEEKLNALINQQAIKRMGTKEDVYNIVKFFLDPQSDFVTGQIIYMGGVF
jgi:3-oxoacyl-[acyl-carrier protein] reductase